MFARRVGGTRGRLAWAGLGMLAAAALLAGCNGEREREAEQGEEVAGQATCAPTDTILARAVAASYSDAPGWTDSAQLHRGPRATIQLVATFDTGADYGTGAVIARITARDSTPYPRLNLAANGTTYYWVDSTCTGRWRAVFIDSATGRSRARSQVSSRHTHAELVRWVDTTWSVAADPETDADLFLREEADSTADGVSYWTLQETTACGRCFKGWCTPR